MDKVYDMAVALRKVERIMDALGKGPVSIKYLQLDERTVEKEFTAWEREYHANELLTSEVITVRNAANREDYVYVIDVAGDSVLTALQELFTLLARKY